MENRRFGLLPYVTIAAIYIFSGLVGHDPWKADEAYVFGMVMHHIQTGDWVVPMLAGEPFMEKPPFYYWVAGALAKLFSSVLPLPDGARLANGLFMSITCGAIARTTQIVWGRGYGRFAVFIFLGIGVLEQSHLMMPDISLLTGFSLACMGLVMLRPDSIVRRGRWGGGYLGLGIGIGFLSKGLLAPGIIGLAALILPVVFHQWRVRSYFKGLALAFFVSLPWLVIWPTALYLRSYDLFMVWFWENNLGRFFGYAAVAPPDSRMLWLYNLPWFTFPGLWLALFVLWVKRREISQNAAFQAVLVYLVITILVLVASATTRVVYGFPVKIGIAILAAPAPFLLPHWVNIAWDWLARVLFGILAATIWLGWIIMMYSGHPPTWQWILRQLPSSFVPHFSTLVFSAALIITLMGIAIYRLTATDQTRGIMAWSIGVSLAWALLSSLWMPWFDDAKSFRSVFTSMPLPEKMNCLATENLGEGERGLLVYFTGHFPVRREVHPNAQCDMLLVQGFSQDGPPQQNKLWKEVWQGARPGDDVEHFWLYHLRSP